MTVFHVASSCPPPVSLRRDSRWAASRIASKTGRALRMGLLATTALTAAALAATPAHANDWIGAVGDWFTPGNWTPGVPTSGNQAVINTGTAQVLGGGNAVSGSSFIGRAGGSDGTVEVGGAGSTWTVSGSLTVGEDGDGALDIADGGVVSSSYSVIGSYAGSTGVVAVDGAGSIWNSGSLLYVGFEGDGELDISGGGAVNSGFGTIGQWGPGAVTVDGAGSIWTNSSTLTVGDENQGTLDIVDGGTVASGTGYLGLNGTGTGVVTVDGAGSTWTSSGNITSGYSGDGALDISDGGAVSNTTGTIGHNATATGTATVDGAGSTWTNSGNFYVGRQGTGMLDITDGGAVSNVHGYIGDGSTGTGAVMIDGAGSTWTNSGYLYVGNEGSGTLDISGGGAVGSSSGYIGNNNTGTGTVTVDGAGSAWTNDFELYVGLLGEGTLDITDGGAVSSFDGYIAWTGTGAVRVDGAGSTWTNDNELFVGFDGDATLDISGGGAVSTGGGFLGGGSTGTGAVTVDGAGSTWTNSVGLIVGFRGIGALDITDGGAVSSDEAYIGYYDTATGVVTVDGAGSAWTNSGDLVLGDEGNATVTLANGGALEIGGDLHIALFDSASGVLNIGAAEGDAAVAAGTLDAGAIVFGDGDGEIVFNHTSDDFVLASDIAGTGTLRQFGSGTTTLTGDSSAFDGDTFVEAGSFFVNGVLGGSMNVVNAILGGSGTIGTTMLGAGAVIAPGNSTGTLSIDGDLTFDAGSTYRVETGPDGSAGDLIHVAGTATLGGASVAHVGIDGTYAVQSTWTILTADGGISGTFGSVSSAYAFLTPDLSYDANNVYLGLLRNDVDFTEVAATPNQQGVAGAANALGSGNPIYDEILLMTEEEARAAFDALSGEAHGSAGTASFQAAQQVQGALLARIQMLQGGGSQVAKLGFVPAAGDLLPSGAAIWGQLFGGWGTSDGNANVAKLDRRSVGFLGGIDKPVGEASRIGVAAGYSRSTYDVSARSSSGDSDNFHIAGYAGTKLGAVDLAGTLSYGYGKSDAERTVIVGGLTDNLTASYDSHTLQASVEAGIDFNMGSLVLTPFAGLGVTHVETDGFTEQGGPSALTFASQSNTTGVSTLGLRARRQTGQVGLTGSLAWRHAFGDVDPASRAAFASAPANPFTVRGAPIAENTLALAAGVDFKLADRTTLTFGYTGEYASDARDHGLAAELRIAF